MHAFVEALETRSLFAVTYAGPITISKGGAYTGNWESNNPDVPAVRIATTQPVTIINSNVRGKGDLIMTVVNDAKITVASTNGYGLNPNVYGAVPGRFIDAEFCDNLVVRDNYLESTSGIYVLDYRGNHTSANTIKITGNLAKNIDGRRSNGAGGWLDFNERTPKKGGSTEYGYDDRQFLQLDQVHGVGGIEIAYNCVINEPGKSRVEDNISIYKSSGTKTSPMLIHDNVIKGAYSIKPWQGSYSDATYEYDWSYSGGGILLGDGVGSSIAFDSGYVKAYYNTINDTTNYGMGIGAGHDIEMYSNRITSTGKLPDGRSIYAQNVGMYIWNSNGLSSSRFFNNVAHDNTIGWIVQSGRNDWWVPDASQFLRNISLGTQQAQNRQ